jgi:DNA-binding response OmpR family regulator
VQASHELIFSDLILDYKNLTLSCSSKNITLTLKESELLQVLISRKNMITPKEILIEKLWGFNTDAEDNNVEVYISFIRKKLKFLKCSTTIKTTRGLGYSLEA